MPFCFPLFCCEGYRCHPVDQIAVGSYFVFRGMVGGGVDSGVCCRRNTCMSISVLVGCQIICKSRKLMLLLCLWVGVSCRLG